MNARLSVLLASALAFAASAAADNAYEIDLSDARSGWLHVRLDASCAAPCELQMPVWSATYQVRDFARFVADLSVETAAGEPLEIDRMGPSRWRVDAAENSAVTVRYRVRADRPGPFGAYADGQIVQLDLAQVLLYADGRLGEPSTLRFIEKPVSFREALALPHKDGVYRAPSYGRLVDTPALVGEIEELSFEQGGRKVRLALAGAQAGVDASELKRTAKRLVSAAADLMGGLPFDEYLFVYVFSDEDGGGMEYRNGTVIYGPTNCRSCGLESLTAHELFHLWNVKRIRPASMEPVDYTGPTPSPSLWFAEGVTSTYAQYLQITAGLMSESEFLNHFERLINDYESRPAALRQSAEESSLEAWFERYPEYGEAERSVSYYLKGELIGHLLDLEIRHRTANRRSLDDLMRRLDAEFAQKDAYFGDSADIQRLVSELIGGDAGALIDGLVRRPEPIDWDEFLSHAGYRLIEDSEDRPDAGLTLANPAGQGVVVASVRRGGPAEDAGFRVGDRILRVDNRRLTGGAYEAQRRLERMVGRRVTVYVDRRGGNRTLELEPRSTSLKTWKIVSLDEPTDRQLEVRRGWLGRTVSSDASGAGLSSE